MFREPIIGIASQKKLSRLIPTSVPVTFISSFHIATSFCGIDIEDGLYQVLFPSTLATVVVIRRISSIPSGSIKFLASNIN